MKRSIQVRLLTSQVAVVLVACCSLVAHAGEPVGGINVSLEQIPGGIFMDFGNDDVPTIPADFFDPGSLPFEGTVYFNLDGPMVTKRRPYISLDGLPPGEPAQGVIPTEILQLELTSIDPITVTTATGQYEFELRVTVLDAPGASSQWHIDHEAPDGGNIYAVDSFFDIIYEIEFNPTAASPGSQRILSFEIPQRLALQQDTPWRHGNPDEDGDGYLDGYEIAVNGLVYSPYTLTTANSGLVLNLHNVPVPEPTSAALAGLALVALALRARHRRRS